MGKEITGYKAFGGVTCSEERFCQKWDNCSRIKLEIEIGVAKVENKDLGEADFNASQMQRDWAEISEEDCLDENNPNKGDSNLPVFVLRATMHREPIYD